ncbi:AAA-ATPase [Mycobacterium phage Leopard]|nr:AAA-ATPase [Mycobacterium phage Leopard]
MTQITMPDNIIGIQDEDEYVNLLIYADSGVGKTVFCGSDDDVLFIAPEDNGTLSAKRFGSTAKKWKINSWNDIVEAYNWLADLEDIPFNWVILDSLTEMQDMCMRAILDEAAEMNPGRDPDVPQLQDWQPYFERFKRLVKAFNSLPVNVIYTALQQDEENEDGEKVVLPMLQGKGTQYAKKVASWMTSFGHMRVQRKKAGTDEEGNAVYEEYRVIQWKASKTVMAKDRTRCLEPRTVIGEGKLNGLKDVRELLENGPKQPAAGRVTPTKDAVARKRRRSNTNGDVNPISLVTAGGGSDDDTEGDDD